MTNKNWLRNKLAEGKREVWRDAETERFTFRGFNARLAQPDNSRSDAGTRADDIADTRRELRASLVVDVLSIRVKARDMKRKGRSCETWLRGSLIRRVIERPKPNRDGIDHNRYSVLIGFLCHQGIAAPDGNRNGYVWTSEFTRLSARAEWLTQLVRREGELRVAAAPTRFEFTD